MSAEFKEIEIELPKDVFVNRKGVAVILLATASMLVGLIFDLLPILILSYFALLLIVLDYYVINSYNIEDIEVSRYVDRTALFQDQFTYIEVTAKNRSRVPLTHISLQDIYPSEFSEVAGKSSLVTAIDPRGKASFSYILRAEKRGIYRLGPIRILFYSPMGLFFREDFIKLYNEITVFPILERSEKMYYMAKAKRATMIFGAHRSKTKGPGTEYYGIREYTRYDDFRTIDWKASARALKLMVREFIIEVPLTIYIMIDSSYSMGLGTEISKLDYAVDVAMFLSKIAVDNHDKVGLLVFSDTVHSHIPARSDPKNLMLFQREFAKIVPEGGKNYMGAMRYLLENWRGNGLIVLLSDLEGDFNELIEAIKIARLRKNKVFILHLYTPYFEALTAEESIVDRGIEAYVFDRYEERRRELTKEVFKFGGYLITVSPSMILPVVLEEYARRMGIGGR